MPKLFQIFSLRAPLEVLRRVAPENISGCIHLLTANKVALKQTGWFKSSKSKEPVDAHGRPLPWLNYSFIYFIDQRIKPDFSVFEYGMGNSTIWWSSRVARVDSCEHNHEWFDKISPKLPRHAKPIFIPVDDDHYVKAATERDTKFDIVVIDGRRRVECARHAVDALSNSGVIVWDNTDRARYVNGIKFVFDKGFKRLDFVGMAPCSTRMQCTSIFYRPGNCLGI